MRNPDSNPTDHGEVHLEAS